MPIPSTNLSVLDTIYFSCLKYRLHSVTSAKVAQCCRNEVIIKPAKASAKYFCWEQLPWLLPRNTATLLSCVQRAWSNPLIYESRWHSLMSTCSFVQILLGTSLCYCAAPLHKTHKTLLVSSFLALMPSYMTLHIWLCTRTLWLFKNVLF